jgi:hypothetical protein
MAASKQHRQPLVARTLPRPRPSRRLGVPLNGQRHLAGALPQQVDRSAPSRQRQPAARIGRHPVPAPGPQRDDDRFLDRLLGNIKVAKAALQLGNNQTGLPADNAG